MSEIIKAEFDIFCAEKHKGSTGEYKGTTNANPVNDISNKNIKPDRTKRQYLSETER